MCGKGVDAAVVTALVRYTIRALSVQMEEPREVLSRLNDVLLAQRSERFCTVVLLRLRHDGDAWSVTLSSGGHPLPLHLDADRDLRPVGDAGSLIGVLSEVTLLDSRVRLAAGDLLVMYTDGVTEGRRGQEFFGEDRLHRAVLEHADAPLPAESILGDVLDFQRGRARDDIAVVAVRVPHDPPEIQHEEQERPT